MRDKLELMDQHQKVIPAPALTLGLAGLIPFVLGGLIAAFPQMVHAIGIDLLKLMPSETTDPTNSLQSLALTALTTYAAVILSFLGGIRWGHLLQQSNLDSKWQPLTISIIPSLVGWVALLLTDAMAIVLLALGFLVQWLYDISTVKRGAMPDWFGRLRTILSTGAIVSLVLGMVGALSMSAS